MSISATVFSPRPVFPTLVLAGLTGWLWAVLIAGRALPWQASRWWLLAFTLAFVVSVLWWWRLLRGTRDRAARGRDRIPTELWGAGAIVAVSLSLLLLAYLSDGFNALLERPYWRMPFLFAAVLPAIATESLRLAGISGLPEERGGTGAAALRALSSHACPVALASLVVLGLLQAVAGVVPIGDDIWHYSEVADAILQGRQYPVTPAWTELIRAGTGTYYPALPTLPALLALSFSLFGRNLVGVAMPTVLATALFPLAFYAACKGITGSRAASYVATVLLYLFPMYQIHILGSPEPDTVFVTLMLLGAAFAAKANSSPKRRYWIGMGVSMGLASLTRHEGAPFSAVLFFTFLLFHRARVSYWLSLAAYFAVLAPFVAVYHSITGEFWPSTFGTGVISLANLADNLNTLGWASLPWFAQAVGVSKEAFTGLFLAAGILAGLGTLALVRKSPALIGVPLAGMGFTAGGFLIHQNLVYSAFPVEFLRHLSFGLPYAAIGLAYAGLVAFRRATAPLIGVRNEERRGSLGTPQTPPGALGAQASRLPDLRAGCPRSQPAPWTRRLAVLWLVLVLMAVSGIVYYEVDRLARPEYYFEGRSSLLWTGDSWLMADVWQHPVPLPTAEDRRGGEVIRDDLTRSLDDADLRRVNLSEPYHWTSLLVTLFGLVYALAPVARRLLSASPALLETRRTRLPIAVKGVR